MQDFVIPERPYISVSKSKNGQGLPLCRDEFHFEGITVRIPENDGPQIPANKTMLREVSGKNHRIEFNTHGGFLNPAPGKP